MTPTPTLPGLFLGANALAIGLIGLGYLWSPNRLLARYALETGTPAMDSMLRSAYGGVFLGMAAIFALGALVPSRTGDGLLFTLLFMGGFALGRIVSLVRVGSPGRAVNALLGYEVVASAVAAGLYLQLG